MEENKIQRLSEWLATPPEERVPKRQYELAEELGLSPPELSALKKELDLVEAPPGEVKALYDHILNEAKKKNCGPGIARLAWEMVNPDKKEAKEAEFTADDYINIGIKIKEQLQDSYRNGTGCCPVCGGFKTSSDKAHLDTKSKYPED